MSQQIHRPSLLTPTPSPKSQLDDANKINLQVANSQFLSDKYRILERVWDDASWNITKSFFNVIGRGSSDSNAISSKVAQANALHSISLFNMLSYN